MHVVTRVSYIDSHQNPLKSRLLHIRTCVIFRIPQPVCLTLSRSKPFKKILDGVTCVDLKHDVLCTEADVVPIVTVNHQQIKHDTKWVKVAPTHPLPVYAQNNVRIHYPWKPDYWPVYATETKLFNV